MKLIPLIFPVGGSGLKPIRGDSRFIAQLLSHLSHQERAITLLGRFIQEFIQSCVQVDT